MKFEFESICTENTMDYVHVDVFLAGELICGYGWSEIPLRDAEAEERAMKDIAKRLSDILRVGTHYVKEFDRGIEANHE